MPKRMEEVLRWVNFGRRLHPKVGQYCMPIHTHALHGDRERFLAEGFDGYVSKPVDMQMLAEELKRVSTA